MEVWSPLDDTVRTLTPDFPVPYNDYSKLISVSGNSELIYYDLDTGVHKFSSATNSWTKIGNTILNRCLTVVLPVTGMSCP
jgi:hypothetical protein